MKKVMLLACAAAAAMMSGQETAQAQCGYGGGYRGGFGYSSFAPRTSFSIGFTTSRRAGSYYNTGWRAPRTRGHWDYHPPSIYRHRNHYHVQPGHYDWHRGRHW